MYRLNKDVRCNIFLSSRDNKSLFILHSTKTSFKAIKRLTKGNEREIAFKIIVLQSLCSFFVESCSYSLLPTERRRAKDCKVFFCVKRTFKTLFMFIQ